VRVSAFDYQLKLMLTCLFEQLYQLKALGNGKQRKSATCLGRSEVMTILVMYNASGYKKSESILLGRNHSPSQFRVSALVQLSAICATSNEICDAVLLAKRGSCTGISLFVLSCSSSRSRLSSMPA
jgi:hypothetical protein